MTCVKIVWNHLKWLKKRIKKKNIVSLIDFFSITFISLYEFIPIWFCKIYWSRIHLTSTSNHIYLSSSISVLSYKESSRQDDFCQICFIIVYQLKYPYRRSFIVWFLWRTSKQNHITSSEFYIMSLWISVCTEEWKHESLPRYTSHKYTYLFWTSIWK